MASLPEVFFRNRPLQSRLLQTRSHPRRPCGLLTGFDNSPGRDFHPPVFRLPFKFLDYIWLGKPLGTFWAHTKPIRNALRVTAHSQTVRLCENPQK
jgi:hypothetical protein